jgi:hypothetical protein
MNASYVSPIKYPTLDISERIHVIEDLIQLFKSGLERLSSPNDERRSKTEFDTFGKAKTTLEKEEKWKRRVERCYDIRNRVLPNLIDTLETLRGNGSHSLSDDIATIQGLMILFEGSLKDPDIKPEDKLLISDRTLPQLRDVLATLELLMRGD